MSLWKTASFSSGWERLGGQRGKKSWASLQMWLPTLLLHGTSPILMTLFIVSLKLQPLESCERMRISALVYIYKCVKGKKSSFRGHFNGSEIRRQIKYIYIFFLILKRLKPISCFGRVGMGMPHCLKKGGTCHFRAMALLSIGLTSRRSPLLCLGLQVPYWCPKKHDSPPGTSPCSKQRCIKPRCKMHLPLSSAPTSPPPPPSKHARFLTKRKKNKKPRRLLGKKAKPKQAQLVSQAWLHLQHSS